MAEAKKQEKITITLTLDEEEAQFLTEILARVGGERTGIRRHETSITNALKDIGFTWKELPSHLTRYSGKIECE